MTVLKLKALETRGKLIEEFQIYYANKAAWNKNYSIGGFSIRVYKDIRLTNKTGTFYQSRFIIIGEESVE